MENFLYLCSQLILQVVWLDSLLYSIYFEFSTAPFVLLPSINQEFWGFTDKNSSVGLTLQNDDVSVADVKINFYYRELSCEGMGMWDLFRISSCVGMTEEWQWWTETGEEGLWRDGERVGTLLTNSNVMAKWKQNMTRGQNPNTRIFSLLKEFSESLCKCCRKSTGGNLMARNICRKIPQKF